MAENVEIVHLPADSMECPLCLETFKAPTLLRCGHTFCKVCLEDYDKKNQDYMECPVCKKRSKLWKSRVAGLPTNFSVKGIKEDLKGNGKSPVFCSLHSEVYKDILCEDCDEFICLTCFVDTHQGHRFKKREELEAYLKKKRKSLSKKCGEKKVQTKMSITNAEQYWTVMHSHLKELDRKIEISFREKSEILRGDRERLSKTVDKFRKNSGKVIADFIGSQKHSLQTIDAKSTIVGQGGIASTSTCKLPDSDALKELYKECLDLENELESDLNETSVAQVKQQVENIRFCPSDGNILDLGILDQEASESENDSDQGSVDQDASELSEDDRDDNSLEKLTLYSESESLDL